MPWAYVRYKLAEHWHVPPWIVDSAPSGEIVETLRIMRIEAEGREKRRG